MTVPLIRSWNQSDLPQLALGTEASQGWDFSRAMVRLCADICTRCPEYAAINPKAILFAGTPSRNSTRRGLVARTTPLRFRGGELQTTHRHRRYQVQQYLVDHQPIYYLITWSLPRFLNQCFEEKFLALFHELYHISPSFDGSLRCLPGARAWHGRSRVAFHQQFLPRVEGYLNQNPEPSLYAFFHSTAEQLIAQHGKITALRVPRPLMVPVPDVPSGDAISQPGPFTQL